MINPVKLVRPEPKPDARERTLVRVEQFKQAQKKLEKVCEEKGMEVPVMTC